MLSFVPHNQLRTEVKDEFLQDYIKVAGSRGGHYVQRHSNTYVCSTVSKHRVFDICIFYQCISHIIFKTFLVINGTYSFLLRKALQQQQKRKGYFITKHPYCFLEPFYTLLKKSHNNNLGFCKIIFLQTRSATHDLYLQSS